MSPLKECFPRLYQVAENRSISTEEMGDWNGDSLGWIWRWKRPLFAWEDDLVGDLNSVLLSVEPTKDIY